MVDQGWRTSIMFPSSTPSTSSKREIYPNSTPLSQVYSHDSHYAHNANTTNTTINANTRNVVNATPSTAARTYKTRERLYYETDYVKSPNSPVGSNNNNITSTPSNSSLFEPFLRNQPGVEEVSHEDLPPTASIHDSFLPLPSSNASTDIPSTFSNLCNGSPMVINGVIGSPMKSNNPNMESSSQWSSVFVTGGSTEMTRSVTVFGFSPNCRNEILVSFKGHGPIESFDSAAEGGSNWLHIVFESEWAAQKALNRNGSIFQGVMIGVIPMQSALEKVNTAANTFMSPLKKHHQQLKIELNAESIFAKKTKSKQEVDLASLPSDSSLVTRAVNYIFGW